MPHFVYNAFQRLDVAQHVYGNCDATSARKNDIEERRTLAIDHGPIAAFSRCQDRFGGDRRFYASTGHIAAEATICRYCDVRTKSAGGPPRISTSVASAAPPCRKEAMANSRMSKGSSLVDDLLGAHISFVTSITFIDVIPIKASLTLSIVKPRRAGRRSTYPRSSDSFGAGYQSHCGSRSRSPPRRRIVRARQCPSPLSARKSDRSHP